MFTVDRTQILWTLVEGTNDIIFSVNKEGSFEYANSAFLKKLKYKDDAFEHLQLHEIGFPGSLEKLRDLHKKVLSGKSVFDQELIFLCSDGEKIEVSGNLIPRYEGNLVVASMGIFKDITDRKEIEREIEDTQAKVEFLMDIMIHDITNINQEILSALELASFVSEIPPEIKTVLNEGMNEMERSSRIISNVRKLSVLESEKLPVEDRDLSDAIFRASIRARAAHPMKKLKLVNNIEVESFSVRSNPFLVDVFYELLSNAMKFDEREEVVVEVSASPIKMTPFLRVEVSDYGRGIPDGEKEDIFDKGIHRRESIKGLGLGLTLVKRVVESLGGYIRIEDRVEHKPDKGAKFVLLVRYSEKKDDTAGGTST